MQVPLQYLMPQGLFTVDELATFFSLLYVIWDFNKKGTV